MYLGGTVGQQNWTENDRLANFDQLTAVEK